MSMLSGGDKCVLLHVTRVDLVEKRHAVMEKFGNILTASLPAEQFELVYKEKAANETTKDAVCGWANSNSGDEPTILVTGFVGRKGFKDDPTVLGSVTDYSIRQFSGP